MENKHKSGFVNIVGNPNVGKSTLMNRLVGERISIITSKAQTTRHRIIGIVTRRESCIRIISCRNLCLIFLSRHLVMPMYCFM